MNELVPPETVNVHATPGEVWSVLEDPAALRRVLPGAESLEAVAPGRYRGVLATRVGFFTARADVDASLVDADPPRRVRLAIVARPRGIGGTFELSVPFELTPLPDDGSGPRTSIRYSLDAPRGMPGLGSFAGPSAIRSLVTDLVRNLEAEVTRRRAERQ